MKLILSTLDRSLAERLRIELEAAGIETLSSSDLAIAAHSPATVSIAKDQDYDEAMSLVRSLGQTESRSQSPTWFRWLVRLALVLILLSAMLLGGEWIFR